MLKSKGFFLCAAFLISCYVDYTTSLGNTVDNAEWNDYKRFYGKDYTNTAITDAYARYYYTYNKKLIANHNSLYARGLRTFGLRINQFTDMRLVSFNALFPVTTPLAQSNAKPLPTVSDPLADSFNPIEELGFQPTIEDQGTVCNSGWAYATAKSVELFLAYQSVNMRPDSLSAQNLIDCAGRSTGCKNQVPQTGFDYLTEHMQELHFSSDYPNRNKQAEPGMCIIPNMPAKTAALRNYGIIRNGDDPTMRRLVNAQYPVVIEFNPTSFEFMHYSEGIFQQPATNRGSHFMTVIGFGVNRTANLNYFIIQNSFNTTWGENGLIKIAYSAAKPLAKSAILPTLI